MGVEPRVMRKIISTNLLLILLPCFLQGEVDESTIEEVAERLFQDQKGNQATSLASELAPKLSLEEAYEIQRIFVLKQLAGEGVGVAGFKAALTTKPSQEHFGLSEAAAGVLLDSMRRTGRTDLSSTEFYRPKIELEIAFVVDKRIEKPLEDVAALKSRIRSALPAIELPDLRFASMDVVAGVDIIAANAVASAFIVGNEVAGSAQDFSNLEIKLLQDGQIIREGKGPEFIGEPWEAALKLVNQVVAQGWTIEPGNILLSGAMGGLTAATEGSYEAQFSSLGIIRFSMR